MDAELETKIETENAVTESAWATRIATTDLSRTIDALAHFIRVFEQAGTSFEHLTCTEAEALAGLWYSLGQGEGDWVLRAHADGDDDCEDRHHAVWLGLRGLTAAEHCGTVA